MIRYERWKVLLGVIIFLMLMGIVGRIDRDSQEALLNAYPEAGERVYVAAGCVR